MSVPLEIQPDLECDTCGQSGAHAMGERTLCVECYATMSSSCAGGGKVEPE
jgi:hypothetical protein